MLNARRPRLTSIAATQVGLLRGQRPRAAAVMSLAPVPTWPEEREPKRIETKSYASSFPKRTFCLYSFETQSKIIIRRNRTVHNVRRRRHMGIEFGNHNLSFSSSLSK